MKLPAEIPKRLRDSAFSLPELEDGEGAWSKADAIAVIEALRGTTVAISDVVVFRTAPWGYAPSEVNLTTERIPTESDTDYAARSRSAASDFVRGHDTEDDDALFALTFPLWKDAA